MTTGHIYILTDGVNTKIGITTDFDKRMSSYNTHNANVQVFKHYPCDIGEAKRIETIIKGACKDAIVGQGKEWFSLSPEAIDRYVSAMLEKPLANPVLPSMHGVRLNNEAHELKNTITKLLADKNIEQRRKAEFKKEELAELFGTSFGLGLPEHKLPPENTILQKEYTGIDLQHCTSSLDSRLVRKAVQDNRVSFPYDDHNRYFYHLVKLDTGHFVALCTARVSMPYLEAIEGDTRIREIVDKATSFGWYCTFHHEWSWHAPDKTGLILYQPKTPVSQRLRMWDGSFRKWTIERQGILKLERFDKSEDLQKCIDDICHDNTFPLDINSYQDLCDKYLEPCFSISGDDEEFWLREPYEFLIRKWKDG